MLLALILFYVPDDSNELNFPTFPDKWFRISNNNNNNTETGPFIYFFNFLTWREIDIDASLLYILISILLLSLILTCLQPPSQNVSFLLIPLFFSPPPDDIAIHSNMPAAALPDSLFPPSSFPKGGIHGLCRLNTQKEPYNLPWLQYAFTLHISGSNNDSCRVSLLICPFRNFHSFLFFHFLLCDLFFPSKLRTHRRIGSVFF